MAKDDFVQANEESVIRLLLIEDDADWTKAVTAYLEREPDMRIVGAAANDEEALRLADSVVFDVALIDIQLTGSRLDGIGIAMELHERTAAKLIMLTSLNDERVMTDAFKAGALQYLEKTRFKELPHAIRAARYHSAPMDALLKELARLQREEQLQRLTAAEREVFELIEAGHTQRQIEKMLFKAESTLKNQVNKMLKKLGARSSKEAVAKVKRGGLQRHQRPKDQG